MKKYLPGSIAALILTIGVASGTAFAGGHHGKPDQFATQAACTFNATPAPGDEASPLYWGACDAVQTAQGGVTVTLVIEP